eukprot:1160947-Pelagomonas_calceolata.AAC.13
MQPRLAAVILIQGFMPLYLFIGKLHAHVRKVHPHELCYLRCICNITHICHLTFANTARLLVCIPSPSPLSSSRFWPLPTLPNCMLTVRCVCGNDLRAAEAAAAAGVRGRVPSCRMLGSQASMCASSPCRDSTCSLIPRAFHQHSPMHAEHLVMGQEGTKK